MSISPLARSRFTHSLAAASMLALLFAAGCNRGSSLPEPEQNAAGAPPASAVEPAIVTEQEFWDVDFIQGERIGYEQTIVRPIQENGRDLVEVELVNELNVQRFGQQTRLAVHVNSIETPSGELLRYTSSAVLGPSPIKATGRVGDGKLEVEVEAGGTKHSTSSPCSEHLMGFFGIEQSLRVAPMKPGERRSLQIVWPIVNQVATFEMTARDYETTKLLDGSQELLRIDCVATLSDGNRFPTVLWTDRDGQRRKTHSDAMQMDSYRTTKEVALAPSTGRPADLGLNSIVKLDKPLADSQRMQRVTYAVELADGDVRSVFPASSRQQVSPTGEHTGTLTVTATSLKQALSGEPAAADAAPPKGDDRQPNAMIQSDDLGIVALAEEAKAGETDPGAIALALESFVYRSISKKNFTQALASAAETAKSREGDCTEHAMLLAALGRACNIPSRVAIGLVYVEGLKGFGYHMWTEMYLNGRWVGLDATLGKGGLSATHLKLVDSSLQGNTAYSSFLPVAQVLGRMKISVQEAQAE